MENFRGEGSADSGAIPQDAQKPLFIGEVSTSIPEELTKQDYDILDQRLGGYVDALIASGRIKKGVFQGGAYLELYKQVQKETSSKLLEAYLRNRRNLRLSERGPAAMGRNPQKILREAPVQVPLPLDQKTKSAGGEHEDEMVQQDGGLVYKKYI
jgi:hypothetical protein